MTPRKQALLLHFQRQTTLLLCLQVYAPLRAASLSLAKLYMQSALNEAAALPPDPPALKAESVVGHLFGSVRLALRVQQFAGGLNRECAGLLASVRQRQSSLQRQESF